MTVDPRLKEWATSSQARVIDAVIEGGSQKGGAKLLGISKRSVERSIAATRKRAAAAGYSPESDMTRPAPSPFVVKGTSTLYKADGTQALQWVKTSLDRERFDAVMREYVEWLVEDARGVATVTPAPKHSDADLLTVYGIGDPHLGLHSWGKETGEDFDLSIAENLNCKAFDRLVTSSPPSETALICEVGDLLHADNNSNRTPASGNTLDVDTRHSKVMMVAVRMLRHMIGKALTKHKHVIVWIVGGNHDPHSSFAVAMCLAAFYENEPRVTIDLSPGPFKYHHFGQVLIGSCHGDGAKMDDLPRLMSEHQRKAWGVSKYCYWYTGHIHHITRKEYMGSVVESFRTLAAPDAWHHKMGYRAGRDMVCIVHHKDFGEIERHRADLAMVREAA